MALHPKIRRRWSDACIVAAPGPSLSPHLAEICDGIPAIAINDAHLCFPRAEVLYACDAAWWVHHGGVPQFSGERWSSHGSAVKDDKRKVAEKFGLELVRGADGAGFSSDPALIHYGENSGFQAVNLAIHFLGGVGTIILVGFDMRRVDGKSHFFGEHPKPLRNTITGYQRFPLQFARAAKHLHAGLNIINCTPGSALTCFEQRDLAEAIGQHRKG